MKNRLPRKWFILGGMLLVLGWIVYFHNDFVSGHLPKWGWVQAVVRHLGQSTPEAVPEDEDPDNTKNEIPVHTARIAVATLHRYVEGFGTVTPRPAREGQMAGGANIASPAAGVVAKVLCQVGQQVRAGDPLIQLDDRLAKAAEEQAAAGLAQAQASLAALQAMPRPDQLQIAQLAVDKAQGALELAQKNYDRSKSLAAGGITSGKNLEQAAQDLAAAQNDLTVSQKQLAILKATPTPEDLHQEQAKVAQASAALAAAQAQQQMLTIKAPIDATVVSLAVNPGESVDTTRALVGLVALDRLMVDLDLPADQLPGSAVGLPAQILQISTTPATGSEKIILGKITFTSPQVDPRNGTVMVGIDLPAQTTLRPGLTVRVRIVAEEHKDCLAVPREAVVADENGDTVIALVEGQQATHKTVKTGLEENGLIEVQADGLKEGDIVVTAGAYGLPQATRVKVVD